MEHRYVDIPHGWLAGAWDDGSEQFCKWEYDAANRLLFVDWADQFCIETLDENDYLPEELDTHLPKVAFALATQLAHGSSASARGVPQQGKRPLFVGLTLRDRLSV